MTNDFNKTENDSTKTRIDKWQIIDEEFISYTGGTAQLISNGECKVHLWETPKDAQLFCDKLNELNEDKESFKEFIAYQNELIEQFQKENQEIRQTIYTLYNQERTDMGKNVLKQLLDAIRVPEKETMQ